MHSLLQGYKRVRDEIDFPDGGLSNPCALTFDPGAIMAIPHRASGARRGLAGPDDGPAQGTAAGGAPRAVVAAASSLGLEAVSGGLIGTGGTSDTAPLLGAPGLSGSWAWNIPEGVKLPSSNESLAFMTVRRPRIPSFPALPALNPKPVSVCC